MTWRRSKGPSPVGVISLTAWPHGRATATKMGRIVPYPPNSLAPWLSLPCSSISPCAAAQAKSFPCSSSSHNQIYPSASPRGWGGTAGGQRSSLDGAAFSWQCWLRSGKADHENVLKYYLAQNSPDSQERTREFLKAFSSTTYILFVFKSFQVLTLQHTICSIFNVQWR